MPAGVHSVTWGEFEFTFGTLTPRRVWLLGRFQALIALASSTGMLRRAFVWGSYVTAKPSPGDIDVLSIMDESFEAERVAVAQPVFDSTRAKLLFDADVFWARASIGEDVLGIWLDTYQVSRSFQKRGIVELELR